MNVVDVLRQLIRIDSTNPGAGEAAAAGVVCGCLRDAGLDYTILEPEPGRVSVISRVIGQTSSGGLLVHGHLDTVAAGDGWSRSAFGAEIADDCVWGRGAVDMKHAVAMMLVAHVSLAAGQPPPHDVLFAYLADEETGGRLGAKLLVSRRPDLLTGVTDAIGEAGGPIVGTGSGGAAAMVQTGEKGVIWARVAVTGSGGHGALTSPAAAPLVKFAPLLALAASEPPGLHPEQLPDWAAEVVGLGAGTTFVPTQMVARSGAPNVVCPHAELDLDVRTHPRGHDTARERLLSAAAGLDVEFIRDQPGFDSPVDGPVPRAIRAAVSANVAVVPFVFSGATDGRHFRAAGIRSYGFMPIPLPAGFSPYALMHAADERIPVTAVEEGSNVLTRMLEHW